MGDEAAVVITKIIGSQSSPVTEAQLKTILEIIHKAFEKPTAIVNAANHQPKRRFSYLSI